VTFPARYTVQYEVWFTTAKDELQNDIDQWQDPVPRNVIGWTSRQTVIQDGVRSAEDEDKTRLQIPADFVWAVRDRVTIPGDGRYQITGALTADAGFHGWKPGLTLDLLKVDG
jgi:hypothetical protein